MRHLSKNQRLVVGAGALAVASIAFAPVISVGCACIHPALGFSRVIGVSPYSEDPSTSRAAILKVVPIGAQRNEVERLMARIADFSEQRSGTPKECSLSEDKRRLTCDYNAQVSAFALVKRGFRLDFRFDGNRRLENFEVHRYMKIFGADVGFTA